MSALTAVKGTLRGILGTTVFWLAGCTSHNSLVPDAGVVPSVPSELNRVTLPEHIVAPPDILQIDAVQLIPRPPYKISPLDALMIQVVGAGPKDAEKGLAPPLLPGQPIEGIYRIEPEGTVNLGFDYGTISIAGKTIPEAKATIKEYLSHRFKIDDVNVALAASKGMQIIRGDHLVEPDGKVTLGSYGSVHVTGLSLEQAKKALEDHLSKYILDPQLSVSISGFNSRVYYVIFDFTDAGEQVTRLPSTGNETVLDAIGELKGLPPGMSRRKIWIARPSPADSCSNQIMPVDWNAITRSGSTATNYQILPGDRVYVAADPWVATDRFLAKIISPMERLFGITLLGNETIRALQNSNGGGGSSGSGF